MYMEYPAISAPTRTVVPERHFIPRNAMHSFVRTSTARRNIRITALAAFALVGFSACEGNDELPTRVTIAAVPTITVTPKAATMQIGGTQQLNAEVRNERGTVVGVPVSWTSSDPEVVTVSSTGLVTAVGVGSGSVVAHAENGARIAASFTVVSAASSVSSVEIGSPASGLLAVGRTRQLTAITFDGNGNPIPADVVWTSSNPNLPVNAAGVITGAGVGTATITATSNGQTATYTLQSALLTLSFDWGANVASLAPGSTTQLNPTPRDGFNAVIPVPVTTTLIRHGFNATTLSPTNVLTIPAGTRGGVALQSVVTDQGGTSTWYAIVNPLIPGVNVTGLSGGSAEANPVIANDFSYYVLVPPGSTRLQLQLTGGSGDPDLYVYRPGAAAASCAPFLGAGSAETCNFTSNVTPGVWRVRIEGFSAAWANWSLVTLLQP